MAEHISIIFLNETGSSVALLQQQQQERHRHYGCRRRLRPRARRRRRRRPLGSNGLRKTFDMHIGGSRAARAGHVT